MADFAGFARNTTKGRSNIEKIREKSQSGGKIRQPIKQR
jgi:hypothetical protein